MIGLRLPNQLLSFREKTVEWRKQHLDWADKRVFVYDNSTRKSFRNKKINYNLVNGYIDMKDIEVVLNPFSVKADFIPEKIQHYNTLNPKISVLRGEELKRKLDYRVVVTNPNALSEIEETKKELLFNELKELLQNYSEDEDVFNKKLEELEYYYTYTWKDIREQRCNYVLNHYYKEYNMPLKFNSGFMDALIVGEEVYQCDVVGGEPIMEKINPLNIFAFRNSYSDKIEDSDVIVMVDYWSPSKIIETYYDVLTKGDQKKIEDIPFVTQSVDSMENLSDRTSLVLAQTDEEEINAQGVVLEGFSPFLHSTANTNTIDRNGNIRVLRIYWKSKRKVKQVKSYNLETGEETYNIYPENYIVDKDAGEEEKILWINEAWEGTKIGKDIYVNMRPRLVQYNRLDNPARCHFGIIGSIYSMNGTNPLSLVDIMKPYAYMIDIIHDRLNKAIANNWGKILKLDLAMIPKGWKVDQWIHLAKTSNLAVTDSFREGNVGTATGKLAGMMNNQSSGVIDAETGNYIQNHINLLEYFKNEMAEAAGISKQREGQISNSATVGGTERATLQSSHITEWYFAVHDDVKRRVLECFLETAKIAMKGKTKKFQYILGDGSLKVMDIEGDSFAEADYGILVDSGSNTQSINDKIETFTQAALQNGLVKFSSAIKIWNTISLSEKQRILEQDERQREESQAQAQQQQMQMQQQLSQMQQDMELMKLEQEERFNKRDNDTKILIEQLKSQPETIDLEKLEVERRRLEEEGRQFDKQMSLQREKLNQDRLIAEKEIGLRYSQSKNKKQ